ncbi:adenosylmethionine decarboxylase [Sneathiella limimaris]|uniref:adenosylmethionine decarboxylase n=1 Tax=Sneathiella limimaris TaxID=1964213 RepID=UPI00146E7C82|nr:adenosylmethionine decarboxylase [Sneathiella limimaris]
MSKITEFTPLAQPVSRDDKPDYFVERDGLVFAGTHLIVDLWQAEHLNDSALIEKTLRNCISAANATLLHFHIHAFEPNGLSGVAVLAESHITFHSWPDQGYMALDIFMCGKAEPHKCIPILKAAFNPGSVQISDLKRGVVG